MLCLQAPSLPIYPLHHGQIIHSFNKYLFNISHVPDAPWAMNEMLEKLVYHPFHHIRSLNFTASPLCVRTKSSLFSLASNVSTKASETLCLWEWNYTLLLYQQDFDAFGTFNMLFLLWLGSLTFLISLINSDLSFKALWKVHVYYETFLTKCSPICESLSFLHESCPFYIFAYCMNQTVVYHLLNRLP